ncbi:histidine phosphatase family protein [Streptomyces sp. NPDC002602]|uniref:histidine phosphatase family protein n=1 Tax=Streptomyces sp. NPDC002602 TaxID=3364654 RepID=UPI0036B1AFF3
MSALYEGGALNTRFIFLRHGQTDDNTVLRISTEPPGPSLNPVGREQARLAGERLVSAVGVRAVYSSPLGRAVETADIVASIAGCDVRIVEELAECRAGSAEGRLHQEIDSQIRRTWERWLQGNLDHPFSPSGETARAAAARITTLLGRLSQFDPSDNAFVLVGHGTLFRIALLAVCPNLTPEFVQPRWLENGGYVEVSMSDGVGRCLSWQGESPPHTARAEWG